MTTFIPALQFELTHSWASAFAREWIDSWNSNDLERILSHYTDDFEMRSPLIRERGFDAGGVLKGKNKVRPYWEVGLKALPPLRFELLGVHLGAASLAITYRSIGRRQVTEVVIFNGHGKVTSGNALYAP